MIIAMLISAMMVMAPDAEPKAGDCAVTIVSDFETTESAMEYISSEVLLPRQMLPLRYDAKLGYMVTERFYYKGWFNCDLVFSFKIQEGKLIINMFARDYGNSTDAGIYRYVEELKKGMKGSTATAFWEMFTGIVDAIPAESVNYYSLKNEGSKKITEEYPF